MTGPAVLYESVDHVVTITYNRPDALNAINAAVRTGLNDAFTRFRDDEDAWVAIVTGTGRAFSVGADIKDGEGSIGTFAGTFWEKPTLNSFESGWEIFKPVIAAVNGYCLGYGLTLVIGATLSSPANELSLATRRPTSVGRPSSAPSGCLSASTGSTRWSSC